MRSRDNIDGISSSPASLPLTPGCEAVVFNVAVAAERKYQTQIHTTFFCFDYDVGHFRLIVVLQVCSVQTNVSGCYRL